MKHLMRHVQWVAVGSAVSLVLALVALFAAHIGTASASPPSNPFVGAWASTDTDGSHQTLAIGGGAHGAHVLLYDDGGRVCDPSLLRPAQASGVGEIDGSVLTVDFVVYCLQPRELLGDRTLTFTYDASTDTLTDNTAVVWHRQP